MPDESDTSSQPSLVATLEVSHKVRDSIPRVVWIAAVINMLERFAYFGLTTPFQNYLQNKIHDPLRPGALGLGQSTATILSSAFTLLGYVTPIGGALLADLHLGRYKVLVGSFVTYIIGATTLFVTSFDIVIETNGGLAGFITSAILIGLSVGGIKSTMSVFIVDQCPERASRLFTRNGQQMRTDHALTVQYVYEIYYWTMNVGSLSSISTTYLEQAFGFWAAFLLPYLMLWVAAIVLLIARDNFVRVAPNGSIMREAIRAMLAASRSGFNLDATRSQMTSQPEDTPLPLTSKFIDELKMCLLACRVFIAFSIAYLCFFQMNINLISQAGQMQTHNIPNDMLYAVNPISVIIMMLIMPNFVYPVLSKSSILLKPITRMTVGFTLLALSMGYAAVVQELIYKAGPCFNRPLECHVSSSAEIPNNVNVLIQIPIYVIQGLAEIFCAVAGNEFAYMKAPDSMKTIVQAVFFLAAGVGAALSIAIAPAARNPYLVIMYGSISIAMCITTIVFWIAFRGSDSDNVDSKDKTNGADIEQHELQIVSDGNRMAIHGDTE